MLFKKSTVDTGALGGWVSGLLGGTKSTSGQLVNHETALSIPVLQNCASLLAESVAQLPLELYRRKSDGGREAAVAHPLYDILRYQPNGWQTPFEFREFGQMSAGLRGNSYSYIERDARGRIKALYPLDVGKVTVLRGGDLQPYYRIGSGDPMPQRLIHHVRWVSLDSYVGLSPIALHANSVGYALALSEYSAKSFLNGTALSGVLERPAEAPAFKDQKTADAITSEWQERFGGSSNRGKIALLQEGMTFRPLTMSNVDAELISMLKLSDSDMARIYKIPLPMVGTLEGATYNNVENLQIQFVIYALMPWLRRHEQAMQRDFLSSSERNEYYIEFNIGGLLRGNQEARYKAYAVGRQWGWLSINDIRRLENMPPVVGGDVYLQPLNMVDAAGSSASIPPIEPDPKAAAAIAEVLK
ncbi:MAG: phage portal protein [Alcaligenes nematophilus]|uniref:phage portal protein n=1 Tax=Alcaligenes TaxID=507 RepID=UPI001EF0A4A4|nr:phage portal protein [Alcaligenes faecalis]ULH05346.1 phage portal protein [Alcaligenes faecalis]